MTHIAYFRLFPKCIKISHIFVQFTFFGLIDFSTIFDHDAFTHHALPLYALDASGAACPRPEFREPDSFFCSSTHPLEQPIISLSDQAATHQ